ncbi:MAG: hypothetical protein K6T75_02755 [Acetobacteraceae bacterium]|nr:hypothetical protein [Acetobacteraceae bacterium]
MKAAYLGRFVMLVLDEEMNSKAMTRPEARDEGDFAVGHTLPAEHMPPPDSPLWVEGVPFHMPDPSWPKDNLILEGQRLALPPGRRVRAHFIGASDINPCRARVELLYRPGPPAVARLGFSYFGGRTAHYGNRPAFNIPLLRTRTRDLKADLSLWYQGLDLDPTRELCGMGLDDVPMLHVFALTLENPGEGGPR